MNAADFDGRTVAVQHAAHGAGSWRSAVHNQITATPDHSDWYAITGEMVDTFRCLSALTRALREQVADYSRGRVLRDDAGRNPIGRLRAVVTRTYKLERWIDEAERAANDVWSEISHIAVEDPS